MGGARMVEQTPWGLARLGRCRTSKHDVKSLQAPRKRRSRAGQGKSSSQFARRSAAAQLPLRRRSSAARARLGRHWGVSVRCLGAAGAPAEDVRHALRRGEDAAGAGDGSPRHAHCCGGLGRPILARGGVGRTWQWYWS